MFILSIYTFLFKEGEKYYLYNSRTNFLSEISGDLYWALNNGNWDKLPEYVIAELRSREIIIPQGTEYDFYYSELMKFNARNYNPTLLSLIIAPTTSCNFDCPYCFEPKSNPKTITNTTIDKIVNFVKSNKNTTKLDITWYGGEPLLAFTKIKKLYKALTHKDMPKLQYHCIITNGYCFNDEVINFFKRHRLNRIQITLDGTKERHDKSRCVRDSKAPTFDRILNNIDNLAKNLVNTHINIRVNINKSNYTDFIEIYNLIKEKYPNNKKISVYPGLIREESEDDKTLCASSFKPSETLELYRMFKEAGVDTSIFPQKQFKGCMMQSYNAYIIGPEGEIYKCWNDVSNPDKVIGNIGSNELNGSSRLIKYATQTSPFCDECKECFVFPICDGGCGYHRYRNKFEGCNYELCTPYKNPERLKMALLNGEIQLNN